MRIHDRDTGDGLEVRVGHWVEVRYVARCEETTFACTELDGAPFAFCIGAGHVVPGWDEGMIGLRVGGTRTISIPGAQAYGSLGYPPLVPPDAAIEIDVELLSAAIQPPAVG